MKRRISKPVIGMVSVGLGSLALFLLIQWNSLGKETYAPPKLHIQETPVNREGKYITSFAPVVKKVAPSVVNIYSTHTIRERPSPPLFDDPFWRRFFGEDLGERLQRSQPRRAQSLGSGVIVSEDGFILTANHVVQGAEQVRVALPSGGKEFTATIVGTDPASDVAVLKVDAKDLPAVTLADSDKLEVGDVVLAIGNPFDFGQTVTMGIVSAVRRGGFGITGYENFIQTDASINRGNSGGALVDAEGRVVGINTAIVSPSGGNIGIGFAVPINMARHVMDRLVTDGKVTRGYLGVSIQDVTPDLAKALNLSDSTGALVGGVQPDTAAEEAGMKDGDVIIEFNGKKVSDSRQLRLMVSQTTPGSKVTFKVLRTQMGKAPTGKTLTARLGELPEELLAGGGRVRPGERRGQTSRDALQGVEVTDLDSRLRRQHDIPTRLRGPLVTNVDPDSNAYEAGLRPGDVILEVDRREVRSADEAAELSRRVEDGRVLLRLWREGSSRYVVVDTSKQR